MTNLYSTLGTGSSMSASRKREVLWNVQQPGDPYDIKRSMIAKLPGDKKMFMGQHLDLICLFQAAEIQRLCEFLEDYRLKYREVERSNLDRHSYEIQIKQLTQRLSEEQSFKIENSKLKQFSIKQSNEIELLQNNSRNVNQFDQNLKGAYQQSIQKINILMSQNKQYHLQIGDLQSKVSISGARYEALESAKNRQIEQLKIMSTQYSKTTYQNEMNALKLQFDGEIKRFELENRRQKDMIDSKNHEISQLSNRIELMNEEFRGYNQNYSVESTQLQKQIVEYQNKFLIFGQQIQRLNIILKDANTKLEQSQKNRKELEYQLERSRLEFNQQEIQQQSLLSEIAHYKDIQTKYEQQYRKSSQSQMILSTYESKVGEIRSELERISLMLKHETDQKHRVKQELDKFIFENNKITMVERENSTLKQQLNEYNVMKRKIAQYESKIAIMSQQLERITFSMKSKDTQLEKSHSLYSQAESLRLKIRQLEQTHSYKITEYQQRISQITQKQGNQWQSKMHLYEEEIRKLNQYLRQTKEENEKAKRRNSQLEHQLSQFDYESTSRIRTYESNFTNMKRENEELRSRVKVLGQYERKIYDYEGKLTQFSKESQRLTNVLRQKDSEIEKMRRNLQQIEVNNSKYEMDYSRKVTGYEQNIHQYRNQNQELKARIQQINNDYNRKMMEMGSEIERLGKQLRVRGEQTNQINNKLSNLVKENQRLNQYIKESEYSSSSKYTSYQQNIQNIGRENEDFRRKLQQLNEKYNGLTMESNNQIKSLMSQNDGLKRQISETNNNMSNYELEFSRRVSTYEQNIGGVHRQNQQYKRRIAELESKIALMSQQLERVSASLRAKNEQFSRIEVNLRNLSGQYEKLNHYHQQYESKTSYEINNKYSSYEQNITVLNREVQQSKRYRAQLESKLQRASGEIEKLGGTLRSLSQENENYKRQLMQMQSSNSTYQVQYNKKINAYETNLRDLSKQNEELVRRLQQIDQNSRKNMGTQAQQIERLSMILKTKEQQFHSWQQNYNNLGNELQNSKRLYKQLEYSTKSKFEGEVVGRYNTYEKKITLISQQNEQLRRKLQQMGELHRRINEYQGKIVALSQENEGLKRKIEGINNSVVGFQSQANKRLSIYQQNINALGQENEDLKRRMQEDLNRRIAEGESKIALLSQQLERSTVKINSLSSENEHLKKQLTENKSSVTNYEYETKQRFSTYEQNITMITREIEQYKRRGSEYEQRVMTLTQQLERTKSNLKLRVDQLGQIDGKSKNLFNENQNLKRQIHDYELEVNRKFQLMQEEQSKLQLQIQRLNNLLRMKVEESTSIGGNLKNLAYENEELKRKNKELEINLSNSSNHWKLQNEDYKRRVQQYENGLRQSVGQADRLKKQLTEMEYSVKNKYEVEVTHKYGQYQSNITNLKRENEDWNRRYLQMQAKLKTSSTEIERLNFYLKQKTDQWSSYEVSSKNKYVSYETNISNMTREIQQYRRKTQDYGDISRRITEYETKISVINREVERLNQVNSKSKEQYRKLSQQYQNHKLKSREYQSMTTVEINKKVSIYEQKIVQSQNKIGIQNQEISRLNLEINRINETLRFKTEQIQKLTGQLNEFKNSTQYKLQSQESEFGQLQSSYTIITKQYQSSKRHLQQYEESIKKLYSEFERLQGIINELKRQRQSLFEKNHVLSQQINRLTEENKDLEEQTKDVRLRLSDQTALHKRITEHMSLMVMLFAEIETLRKRVKDKEKEVEQVRRSSLAPHIL